MGQSVGASPEVAPLVELEDLVRHQSSGEYICASGQDEVHVYPQHGRVAWAADTRHLRAFSRHLKEHGVAEARLEEIIAECSRLHAPIGEKLIEHGLATPELVHQALRRQIALAMETLQTFEAPRAVFLTRTFRQYRVDLTFDLASVLPAADAGSEQASLLSKLLNLVPELGWAVILEGSTVLERASVRGTGEGPPERLVEAIDAQAVDVGIVRSESGALVGAGIPWGRGTRLWCEVGLGAPLGGAIAQIWTLLGLASLTPPPRPTQAPGQPVGGPSAEAEIALESLAREPELLGLFAGESAEGLRGAARDDLITSMARRRCELLSMVPGAGARLGTLAEGLWCIGARRPGDAQSLWIVAEGRMPQGMLWAQLPALERSLAARGGTAGELARNGR
jgi:hypothetical protein